MKLHSILVDVWLSKQTKQRKGKGKRKTREKEKEKKLQDPWVRKILEPY